MHAARSIYIQPAALAAILVAELLLLSLAFDAYRPEWIRGGAWFGFLSYAGEFAIMLITVGVFVILGLLPRLKLHLDMLHGDLEGYPYLYFVLAQLIVFALFAWCTRALFGQDVDAGTISTSLVLGWGFALLATGGLWLLGFAPLAFWRKLVAREYRIFIAALGVGLFAWVLATYAQSLWTPLSDLTFSLSAAVLSLGYPEIVVDPQHKLLGVGDFVVNIAPQCSGYEGMGLMAIFTGFYLSLFRHEFRFPQALLLFPIGIVTIWAFNSLRIAALVAIGASHSPAVAVGGFHSQAGWISFIVVIVAMLLLAYRMPFFSRVPVAATPTHEPMTRAMALLIPFIVLLAATILTSAMSADFDWLYPLRVIAVGAALAACWRVYGLARPGFNHEPWIAGAVVFALWLLLVSADAAENARFADELFSQSPLFIGLWILLRLLGSVVTVPIAEEFLFRGYLLARLARQDIALEGRIAFSWIALVLSSILFGLMHGDWLAGIAAGLVYGWVRYRGRSIWDAVIAHGWTNLLLSIYVLGSGNWSLW